MQDRQPDYVLAFVADYYVVVREFAIRSVTGLLN
jgi:hypothetical protein